MEARRQECAVGGGANQRERGESAIYNWAKSEESPGQC